MATERAAHSWPVVPRATPGLLCPELCRELLPVCCVERYYWFGVPRIVPVPTPPTGYTHLSSGQWAGDVLFGVASVEPHCMHCSGQNQ